SPTDLLRGSSLLDMAAELSRQMIGTTDGAALGALPTIDSPAESAAYPLSHGQRALWFLQRMSPDRAAYKLPAAVRVLRALGEGPLLRVSLLKRPEGEHVLLLVAHHIVTDFWSLAVLLREMGLLYEAEMVGVPARLPLLPLSYAGYVRRQSEMLEGTEGERL